ncbi:hypothetical protein F4819DRAFT_482192 [Hypoxylon fuscum]|nr:hypothetical protein F4819DRAFT_482192 [Hypoxylon fuscum]
MWPAATQAVPALSKVAQVPGAATLGLALAHGLETHGFDILVDQPEWAACFANAMVYFNSNADLATHHACDAFDWESVSQVVNIGGSAGSPRWLSRHACRKQDKPVRDADVHHVRWIFHDWPDGYCLKLLRALMRALKPGANLAFISAT